MDTNLVRIIGDLIPDDAGMLCLSSEPQFGQHNLELPFDERYIHIPSANIAVSAQPYIPLQKNLLHSSVQSINRARKAVMVWFLLELRPMLATTHIDSVEQGDSLRLHGIPAE